MSEKAYEMLRTQYDRRRLRMDPRNAVDLGHIQALAICEFLSELIAEIRNVREELNELVAEVHNIWDELRE